MSASPQHPPHLVNLKVLRASRFTLAPHQSLHGFDTVGPGRDALRRLKQTEKGGMMALPSSFGVIYLGETFSAVLSLSNDLPPSAPEADSVAHSVSLTVEMHTGLTPENPTAKHFLTRVEARTEDGSLSPGQSLETMAVHELKQLGAHALVCTATYGVQVVGEDGTARMVNRTLRKVYKFQVTNPISLRTKALAPTPASPTSFLSPTERAKIFLEVQIQNHCDSSMWFERMRFETLPGFTLEDQNDGLYEGAEALLPPGGLRQFLYILQAGPEVPLVPPGASQGLGRIDIGWRTRNGEVGRLLSSTLGRRVPQTPSPDKPAATSHAASVYSGRTLPVGMSPALPPIPMQDGSTAAPAPPSLPSTDGLAFDVTVSSIQSTESTSTFARDDPFSVNLRLTVSSSPSADPRPRRRLRLAAQHVQWHPSSLSVQSQAPPTAQQPRLAYRPSATLTLSGSLPFTQSHSAPPSVTSLQQQQHMRPSTDSLSRTSLDSIRSGASPAPPVPADSIDPLPVLHGIQLPRPVPMRAGPPIGPLPSPGVLRLGGEVVDLGEIILSGEADTEAVKDFRVRYLPLETGLVRVGGLRVLLLENEEEKEGGLAVDKAEARRERMARVVWEAETIVEMWAE
ncbi:hypothetical protein JCM10295v2_007226 [Rhodotorula toruloides]